MPIVYRASRALGTTIVVWDGDITSRDLQRQLVRISGDPEWPAGAGHLVDLTTIGTVTLPDPELLELLYAGTNLTRDVRVAVIVRPDFADAAGAPYKTASREFDVAAFTDVTAASEYLGLDPAAAQSVIDELRQQL